MNEIKLANYALVTVMLISMATFCVSLNTLTKTKTNTIEKNTTTIVGYY